MVALKKILLVAFVLSVCAVAVTPAQAQTINPTNVQTTIDTALALKVNEIKNCQSSYLIGKSQYFQVLWTHLTAPVDGALIAPDNLGAKTSYQTDSFLSVCGVSVLPSQMPMRARVDIYDGPNGKGYTLTLQAIVDGKTYQRTTHLAGNETYREQAWFEVRPFTP